MRTTVAALMTTLLAACGTGAPTEEVTRTVTLGSFEAEVDTTTGTFRVWTPTPAPSGGASIASIGELPEGSGAGGYVTVANAGIAVANDPNGCATNTPGAVATVRVTSHYPTGSYLRNVYAQINSTNPVTGSSGCNSASTFPSGSGLSNTLGLWGYGPINPTEFADATWRLSRTSTASYRFSGKVYGEVVAQVVPVTTQNVLAITNPTAISYTSNNGDMWVVGAAATSTIYQFPSASNPLSLTNQYVMTSFTASLLPAAAVAGDNNSAIIVVGSDPATHNSIIQRIATSTGKASATTNYTGTDELVAVSNDSKNNVILAADRYGNRVRFFAASNLNESSGSPCTTSAPCNIGQTPVALVFAGDAGTGGNTWVANFGSNTVTVLVPGGTGQTTFTGTAYATGAGPVALAYDGANYVWVANQKAFTVTRHSKTAPGTISTFAVTNQPDDIAIDGALNVWVLSKANRVLTKLNSAGVIQATYALSFTPTKIRYFGGYLWIGDAGGSILVRWTG